MFKLNIRKDTMLEHEFVRITSGMGCMRIGERKLSYKEEF